MNTDNTDEGNITMSLSLVIGLTNERNLNCAHCYRMADRVYLLSLQDIKTICESLPIESAGMGTG